MQREGGEVAVGRTLAQPQSEPGIDRRPGVAHEYLSRTGCAELDLHQLEVLRTHLVARVGDDPELGALHAHAPGSVTGDAQMTDASRASMDCPSTRSGLTSSDSRSSPSR